MIRLLLTDVDGCLTDGTVIYDSNGNKLKKFNMHDGMALSLLKKNNIMSGIITSDVSVATKKRAEDLNFDFIKIGVKNKLEEVKKIIEKINLNYKEVAYFGDDIQDLETLKFVGFSGAPNNSVPEVKNNVKYITKKNGGDGAFREFAEVIIKENRGDII